MEAYESDANLHTLPPSAPPIQRFPSPSRPPNPKRRSIPRKSQAPETLDHNCNTQTPQNQNCNGFRDLGRFPVVVHLLLRLRGGKGGFGSLLRGAATKAGQKKTNNFDACRDMSGRRLRHVNAEKKLEEWRAEAEERKLEKMAEEYIKKKTKEVVKSGKSKGGDSAEKYVAKYREDSAKCMEEVDRSVRESIKGLMSSKRKSSVEGSQSDSKRLKIWYGKRKLGDSDSEDGSDEGEGEDPKSVIIDTGNHSDSSKEAEGSSGSLTGRKLDAGSLDQGSSGSGSEEEDAVGVESFKPDKNLDVRGENGIDFKVPDESDTGKLEEINSQLPGVSCSEEEVPSAAEVNNSTMLEPIQEEAVSVSVEVSDLDKPLNFDEYHSVAELEVCSWNGTIKNGTSSPRLEMWGYPARTCSQALPAQNHTIRDASKEAVCQEMKCLVLESGPVFVLLSLRITNSVQEFNLYSYSPPPAECGGRATAAVADTGGASTASESELIAFLRAIDFATLNKQIADNMGTVAKDGMK
ncbi:hypothetical protein DH2020_025184 [Rehmannia glutinosa]|uniref:SDE2-like domain-containing protein n=1 Tax=Rehmannia glutinosa TaxID=99300 RepID=A0ABR0W4B5_REHGL